MTVRLNAPWAGQLIGTLYTGSDEGYLIGVGKASIEIGGGQIHVNRDGTQTLRTGDAKRVISATNATATTIRVGTFYFSQAPIGVLATIRKDGAGTVAISSDDGTVIGTLTTTGQTAIVRKLDGGTIAIDGSAAVSMPLVNYPTGSAAGGSGGGTVVAPGQGGGGVTPTPSALYTVAGSRIMTQHDTQFTAASGTLGQVYQQLLGVASWDGPLARVGYMNCRNVNGRIGYIANSIPIDAAAFMIVKPADINLTTGIISAARFVPITFNGQAAATIPTGANPDAIVLVSDAMPVAAQTGDYVFLQTSVLFVNAGDAFCPVLVTGANFPDVIPLGERFQQAATTQSAKVGTIITANTGPTGGPVGATSFFMTGCPDRENSFVFIGDSIGQGSATGRDFYDAGGVYAAFKQAMYSTSGGGRKHFIDCSTFSDAFNKSSPTTFPYANTTPSIHFAYKAVFDKLGNVPFRHVACQLGHNDVNSGLAAMQARFNEMYSFFTTTHGTTKWVQFGCSTATTPANNSFQTNEADQTVNGSFADVAQQWNDLCATGMGGKITGYIPHQLSFQNGLKFKQAGLISTTLVPALTAATASLVTLSTQVPRGTLLVFEPGDATNFDAGNYIVKSVVANGANWDHQFITVNGFNRTVQKAHAAGAVVKEAPSPDQEHLSPIVHERTRDFILTNYKAAAFA